MSNTFKLVPPNFAPPLDPDFRPAVLANKAFRAEVEASGQAMPLILALDRGNGYVSRFETIVFPDDHPRAEANLMYIERILKFLLWQRGGVKIYVAGSQAVADHLTRVYAPGGEREFDYTYMGKETFMDTFEIIPCTIQDVPPANEASKPLGRHLDGCRIGFDLGASDRKVSAVVDGEAIFSEEVIWEPRKNSDPDYHYREIKAALETAASKLPRVDAIGGSSAGVIIDNQVMVASLFRAVAKEDYHRVRDIFTRIRGEMQVPLEVVNDGEVTALAGSMSLEDNGVLGIALGSSEAGGYVNLDGNITGWLNELAFCPVDYNPNGPVDEWSGDKGTGALYFSQQCVFRLAPKAGIEIPGNITDAEKLKIVQEKLEAGHDGARKIWESMGYYMGYAIAHYADFYELRNVLILGRCTSGSGGQLILGGANEVLASEFPELAKNLHIQLPDEKSRRVGQSIAAASLPALG